MSLFNILAAGIIGLQAVDGYLTYKGLTSTKSGIYEANPIIRKVLDRVGILPGLLIVKSLSTVICVGLTKYMYTNGWHDASYIILALAILLYVYGVINNYSVLKR